MDQNLSLLSGCDKEEIQFIAGIQPFGALLVTDRHAIIVAAAFGPMFDIEAVSLIGKHLSAFLGKNFDRIYESIDGLREPSVPFLIKDNMGAWLTCVAYNQDELTIFEVERVPTKQVDLASVKFMMDRGEGMDSYLSFVTENLQMATGFDRVMIYKFPVIGTVRSLLNPCIRKFPHFTGTAFRLQIYLLLPETFFRKSGFE